MASPFKFFRKYSGGMMIVMVILSMLLFTMTDLFSDPGRNLWLLGLLIGGAVFAIAGIGQGRWLQWGLGGAVLGTLLGVILPEFVQGGGLSTSLGVITNDDIYDMQIRRSLANEFVAQSTEACFGEGTRQFATYFGFGHPGNEDVVLGRLLRAEAERLGITVDSRMVGDYLKRITSDKLTAEDYVRIRNSLTYDRVALTEDTLQEILADEIKARMAYQMLRTRPSTLPPGAEVYWQYFRRLNVRQQIVTAALDVNDFVDQIEDPTDQQVAELFDTYRRKMPNEVEPGSPGFRLPLRAKLAYLELDSKSVEQEIGEISDADVQKYYDDNKETPLIRTPVLPDSAPADMPSTEEEKAEAEKSDTEKADAPKAPQPDAEKPAEEKSESKTPAPAAEEKPAPAEEKATEDKPADDKPPAAAPESSEPEAATEDKKENQAEDAADDSCGPFEPDESADDDNQPEETAEAQSADKKPADADAAEPAAAKADDQAPKAADAKAAAPADKPAADLPTLTIPDVPAAGAVPTLPESTSDTAPEIQYEYRELDDTLKQEIREEIRRQRVEDKVQEKLNAAKTFMDALASQRTRKRFSYIEEDTARYGGDNQDQQEALKELRESMQPFHEELNQKLKDYAAENGFAYVETPMISYQDLVESEDYSISEATEPTADPMNAGRAATVPLTVFRSFTAEEQANDAQLYFVRRARRVDMTGDGSVSQFAYWATDFSLSHVPDLDEPGIRETVIQEWKRLQARELVKKRGEALAQQVREGLAKDGEDRQDMPAVLNEATVTGTDDSAKLAVRKSNPFTWLRTSSAAPNSFQQPQASLSQIQFDDQIGGTLNKVGDEFMETIFVDMNDEEVDVVPNGDRSVFYVVHVTNRFPTPEIGEDVLRDRFATEAQKFSFRDSPILPVMQQQLDGPAGVAWEKDLWRKYGVDPDGEPEE